MTETLTCSEKLPSDRDRFGSRPPPLPLPPRPRPLSYFWLRADDVLLLAERLLLNDAASMLTAMRSPLPKKTDSLCRDVVSLGTISPMISSFGPWGRWALAPLKNYKVQIIFGHCQGCQGCQGLIRPYEALRGIIRSDNKAL